MYPRPFEYTRAESVADAVSALGANTEARVLAGGQSLLPMLSLGLARPSLLVDINALELAGVERLGARVRIGGLTRHRELERSAEVRELLPLAAEAAAQVGNPRVRNRGTFGGSLSHADPAAELAAVTVAHGGEVVLAGPAGERNVPVEEFLRGYYETAAEQDEMLVRAELDVPPDGSGTSFVELSNRAFDFAVAAAAAIVSLADSNTCARVRIALIGAGGAPVRLEDAERACLGEPWDDSLGREVARLVSTGITPAGDPFVPAEHRRRCASACVARAVEIAWARARESVA